MNCPHCKSECKPDWKYCVNCAKPLLGELVNTVEAPLPPAQSAKPHPNVVGMFFALLIGITLLLFFTGAFDGLAVKPPLTMEKYNCIYPGMSYSEVCKVIGEPGEEMASTSMPAISGVMGGVTTKMYGWKNRNGANMNAMFENNKLMNKAQFGLK